MMKVAVDHQALSDTLKHLAQAGADMRPVMRTLAGTLAAETALNFEDEGRPAWVPSLAAKERQGMTLSDSGHLRRSITTQYDRHSVVIGTNVEYARIHQLGGTIERKGRQVYFKQDKNGTVGRRFVKKTASNFAQTAADHAASYPARPYLPIDETGRLQLGVEQKLLRDVLNYLSTAAKS